MNTLKRYSYVLLIFLIAMLASCEEFIEIDLNSSAPILVAEGVIEPGEPVWLRLSYSSNYFSTEAADYYENSIATIHDENGNSESLKYEGEGLYRGIRIIGKVNTSYTLKFTEGNKTYKASSKLLSPVKIKDTWFEKTTIQILNKKETAYYIHVRYSNNSNQENYYLFQFYTNGELQKDWYSLANSRYYPNDVFLDYKPVRVRFDRGDKVKVFAYSIDEATYNYYSQLNDLLGSNFEVSSTPYNPISNFGTDVMGYFTAWSYDTFQTVVE